MSLNKKITCAVLTLCLPLGLSACAKGSAQEALGLTRSAPDEFTVVKRAPLAMPPDYTLRPPRPGAARPQEEQPDQQAREVVFGGPQTETGAKPTSAEAALLQQTGATQADPDIRGRVDYESSILAPKQQPVAKKLLNIGKDKEPEASVVNATEEAARLKRNQAEGKPVTEGATPSREE